MIDFYNHELSRYQRACNGLPKSEYPEIVDFINNDPTKISWTDSLKINFSRLLNHDLDIDKAICAIYRPFSKSWLYYDKYLNQRRYQMPKFFPDSSVKNLVISVNARHRGDCCVQVKQGG